MITCIKLSIVFVLGLVHLDCIQKGIVNHITIISCKGPLKNSEATNGRRLLAVKFVAYHWHMHNYVESFQTPTTPYLTVWCIINFI